MPPDRAFRVKTGSAGPVIQRAAVAEGNRCQLGLSDGELPRPTGIQGLPSLLLRLLQ